FDRIDHRARAAEATRLRAEGVPYREIADRLGYPSENAANKAVLGLLRRTEVEAVDELRALEAERLDYLTRVTLEGITASVSSPQGLSGSLVSAAVRISERRARLLGLDAPHRVGLASPVDIDGVAREFTDLLETIGGGENHQAMLDAPKSTR
ncbi:MAG: hypothetical protein ACR2MR_09725, partial [Dietzia maris]